MTDTTSAAWTSKTRPGLTEHSLRRNGRVLKVRDLGDQVHAVTRTGFVKVMPPGTTADEAKAYLEGL